LVTTYLAPYKDKLDDSFLLLLLLKRP